MNGLRSHFITVLCRTVLSHGDSKACLADVFILDAEIQIDYPDYRQQQTHMLHARHIYLQSWVMLFGQMMGFILQHHGSH